MGGIINIWDASRMKMLVEYVDFNHKLSFLINHLIFSVIEFLTTLEGWFFSKWIINVKIVQFLWINYT